MLIDSKPERPGVRRRARASSSTGWMRLTAACTSGAKSWTPNESRLKPSDRSALELRVRRDPRVHFDGDLGARLDVEVPATVP